MAGSFCGRCGRPVPAGGRYCPSCGVPVSGPVPIAPSGPYYGSGGSGSPFVPSRPAPIMGPPGPGFRPGPPDDPRAIHRALASVRWAGFAGLAQGVVSLLVIALVGISARPSTGMNPSLYLHLPSPHLLEASIVVAAALGVLLLLLVRSAFRTLTPFEPNFSTPAALALAALVGEAVAALGAGLLFYYLIAAVQCAGGAGHPVPTSCLITPGFGGAVALAVIGGIVALVGFIGVLIGIWRLGTYFGRSLFKVGAILILFPFLSMIGWIFVAVESHGQLTRENAARFRL